MPNYDDGESFAVGDGEDRIDWSRLRRLRKLVQDIPDPADRRAVVIELLQALYGDELDVR
jgi:hypothetical protein